jgi:PD-(D/E)XK nuclease superfamily
MEKPQSPFIEGTQIQWAWDSTALGAFKKCPRYYQYKMIDGWTRLGDAIHLRWGIEFHKALEDYEHQRLEVPHDDAVREALRRLLARIQDWDPDPKTKSEETKTKDRLVRSVVWYLDHYEEDAAKTVVLTNGKPAVEVSFQFELDYGPEPRFKQMAMGDLISIEQPYVLCGHLDKLVEFGGDRYVLDHKTTTNTPSSTYFSRYDIDNQMTLYTLAGQIILNSPVKGVIVDAIQVAVGFSRPVRGFTYRTAEYLEEWLDNLKAWLADAERCATEGFWPMNDTSCDKFGGCEFREACSKSPAVRKRWLEASFERTEPWNPLKIR